MTLEKMKLLYEWQQVVIKSFNNYSSIVSEAYYKTIHGKRIPSMLVCVAWVASFSDHSNLTILSPKQMLQRLPIALAQVKPDGTFENLLKEIRPIIYSLYRAKRNFFKKYINNIINSIKL